MGLRASQARGETGAEPKGKACKAGGEDVG